MKHRGFMRMNSVGMKLFVILFTAVVALSGGLGFSSYSMSKEIIREQVASASSQAIEQAADKLDFLFAEYESLSRQLAVDQTLKSDLETVNKPGIGTVEKAQAEDRIRKKLDALKGSDERLQGVRLVAKSLQEVESYKSSGVSGIRTDANVEGRVKNILDADGRPVWFPALKKGFFDAYTEPTITMGRLLRNLKHPEAEYYLLFEIREKSLGDILSNLKIGKSGEVRVLTADNKIVHAVNSDLLESVSTIKLAQKLQESSDSSSFRTKDEHGVKQLVVYKALKTANWRIMGFAPESDFLSAADKLIYVTLYVLGCAVIVAVLIGYILLRMVGRPLDKLCRLMEEGERGNLSVRTHFKGQDEIGRLGHSFNSMLEQISKLVERTNGSTQELLVTAEQLTRTSKDTSTAAGEMAGAAGEIAQGAASLADEAENGTMLVEEVGKRVSQVNASNTSMNESAARIITVSQTGQQYMEQLVEKTEAVSRLTGLIEENSGKLTQSTDSIKSILAPMVDITKQTNILSLNASIEASRAGAAGKGFMVIAEEIRRLAAQSGHSIETVSAVTEDIQETIRNTVDVLLSISPMFTAQLNSVKEAASIFKNVKQEMERFMVHIHQSSASVDELNHSQSLMRDFLNSISSVVEQTNASTQEVASMAADQHEVSEELVQLSNRLEELAASLKESLGAFQVDLAEFN